ncbi:threonine/serine exporter family protein, partial [Clostridium polynesiense]|uniref:threonine/serine exporter family protein n=1 Tax=Clostridium polynesiense TaxID=1325933 RepID=UPI00058E5708
MKQQSLVQLAVEAGKIILENGGETYRVEETINRICDSYNVKFAESFVTPTGIMVSAYTPEGTNISVIKVIKKRTVDLEKISSVNELSRNITSSKLSPEEFQVKLNEINSSPRYNLITTLFFSGIVTSFFTLLFGGNVKEALVAFLIGIIIKIITILSGELEINDFFVNIMGGAIASAIAILFVHTGFATDLDKIIIGSIMLLVPGIAITNAIR